MSDGFVQQTVCVDQPNLLALMNSTASLSPFAPQVDQDIQVCISWKEELCFDMSTVTAVWIHPSHGLLPLCVSPTDGCERHPLDWLHVCRCNLDVLRVWLQLQRGYLLRMLDFDGVTAPTNEEAAYLLSLLQHWTPS